MMLQNTGRRWAISFSLLASTLFSVPATGDLPPIDVKPTLRPVTAVQTSADAGDIGAMLEMAWRYENGRGVGKDPAEVCAWLEKAAIAGSPDAYYLLATRILAGHGAEIEPERAVRFLRRAAEAGLAPAQYQLALACETGRGTDASAEQAFSWMSKAAAQDYPAAQAKLGDYHRAGQGTPADEKAALDWYQKAADQGAPEGLKRRGDVHREGIGTPKNIQEAIKYYTRAAVQKDVDAQWALATVFLQGDGVPKNPARARDWVAKAAEQGHTEAIEVLISDFPDVFKRTARKLNDDDDNTALVGSPVTFEGSLSSIEGGMWTVNVSRRKESFDLKVDPGALKDPNAREGRRVQVWGILDKPGHVRAAALEVPIPKYSWKSALKRNGAIIAGQYSTYTVVVRIENTGDQPIAKLSGTARLYQVSSPNDYTRTFECAALAPGEKREIEVPFQVYNWLYGGASSTPRIDVKFTDADW